MTHVLALTLVMAGATDAALPAPAAAECDHLPRVQAPAAVSNQNLEPAGSVRVGMLSLRLEAGEVAWYPEGPHGCAVRMHAFAEEGRAASIPGPLIRVGVGTDVHVTLRNDLDVTIHVRGLQDRDVDSLTVTPIQSGASQEFRFRASTPGTFYYWASRREGASQFAADEDGQLIGALIVDPPDAHRDDRVFVLTKWALQGPAGERLFELNAINGLSWPHTERLSLLTGEPVRWRVINGAGDGHLMHLHGFYFRVLALGDGVRDDALRRARRSALIVTEAMGPGWTMLLEWTPDRPGNWIFHCHILKHMSPDQRLERVPVDGARVPVRDQTTHAEHDMAGMVLGVTVRAPPGAVPASDDVPRRRLRLFANARAGVFGTRPGFGFVLQEGDEPPAQDSVRIPGSPIILTRGESVEIAVLNRLAQPLAVHWHGLELESFFDGVPGWSGVVGNIAPSIVPGDSFIVRLTPPRSGTFMYHVHNEHDHELSSGLYGAFLVLEPGERWDPGRDLIFVIADAGPGGAPGAGTPPFINGTSSPTPVELIQDETYRFRFIHITANDGQQVTLEGPGKPQWRALARDGADQPAEFAIPHQSRNATGPGTTFDYEFIPRVAGEYTLRVAPFGAGATGPTPREPTVVPIHVRER